MPIRPYTRDDLPGVLDLCEAEGWPSFSEDAERAHRVLTAPGVTTMVAVDGEALPERVPQEREDLLHEERAQTPKSQGRSTLLGFAQLQSDGEIQAHLSLIVLDPRARRQGLGRALIAAALERAGGERVDLVTDSAEDFYAALPHIKMSGFRLYLNYTGPDRYRPGVVWKAGRKIPPGGP